MSSRFHWASLPLVVAAGGACEEGPRRSLEEVIPIDAGSSMDPPDGSGPSASCDPERVASSAGLIEGAAYYQAPAEIALTDTHVYWTHPRVAGPGVLASILARAPRQGGAAEVFVSRSYDTARIYSLRTAGSEILWGEFDEPSGAAIQAVAQLDETPRLLAAGSHISPFAVDASDVFYTDEGRLFRAPRDGSLVQGAFLVAGFDAPLVDRRAVFYQTLEGTHRLPKDGDRPALVAAGAKASAQDDAYLYWVDEGGLRRVAKSGGAIAMVAMLPFRAGRLQVAEGRVYVSDFAREDPTVWSVGVDGGGLAIVIRRPGLSSFTVGGGHVYLGQGTADNLGEISRLPAGCEDPFEPEP
jgi:hypothetical protein